MNPEPFLPCAVCGNPFPSSALLPARSIRPVVVQMILAEHPDWSTDSFICRRDLNAYKTAYVQKTLTEERGELGELEKEVLASLRTQDALLGGASVKVEKRMTLGERVADRVATFGGSWTFLILFGGGILLWIILNVVLLTRAPFDPYPFILLNLILSCLASVQAPIIMMSQNRQAKRDREESENDYRVNLKAEFEIRHLHAKFDLLMSHQWEQLLQIQEIQTELIKQLLESSGEREGA